MKIYMNDVRRVMHCSKGTREFFKRNNLDFSDFLKNGIDAEIIEATGDAMALHVVRVARGQQQ